MKITKDDIACEYIGQFGPNPDCGCCGGEGTVTRTFDINKLNQRYIDYWSCPECGFVHGTEHQHCQTYGYELFPF